MKKVILFTIPLFIAISCTINKSFDYFQEGIKYDKTDNYTEAEKEYTLALNVDNKNIDAYNNRGLDRCNLFRYKEAISDFTKALEIEPNNFLIYCNRGFAEQSLGLKEEAMKDYSSSLKYNPKYYEAYNDLSTLECKIGDATHDTNKYILALQYLDRAFKLDFIDSAVYNNRGAVKFRLGRYKDAIRDYTKGLEHYPDFETMYLNTAESYEALGEDSVAMTDYHHALRLSPKDTLAYNALGKLKYRLGNYKEALQYFGKAIKFSFAFGNAYYHRAMTEIKTGDKENACKDFYKALQYHSDGAQERINENCK